MQPLFVRLGLSPLARETQEIVTEFWYGPCGIVLPLATQSYCAWDEIVAANKRRLLRRWLAKHYPIIDAGNADLPTLQATVKWLQQNARQRDSTSTSNTTPQLPTTSLLPARSTS